MLTAVAALLVTVGVMLVALRLLGRLQGTSAGPRRAGMLEVLDRVGTGPRTGVVLVRVADRVLIVGVAQDHTFLGELEGAARDEVIGQAEHRSVSRPSLLARFGLAALLMLAPAMASAQVVTAPPPTAAPQVTGGPQAPVVRPPTPPTVDLRVGSGDQAIELSGAVGVVVLMGVLALIPAVILLMTGFTRILIVLAFLRSAIGTQSAPPTQLLVAVALLLTVLVMRPVLNDANDTALQPYLRGEIGQVDAYRAAIVPMRRFMLANTRTEDVRTFVELAGEADAATIDSVGTTTIVTAFVTSELRAAFQMGFAIFLPFLVIDLIVASVLMSMGMFMLPPVTVALPFKLLLFVLADGWSLVMQGLVASFKVAA